MARQLKTGDWLRSSGESLSRIERELKSPIEINGHELSPTHENPEYPVRSENSAGIAAYQPALRRVK